MAHAGCGWRIGCAVALAMATSAGLGGATTTPMIVLGVEGRSNANASMAASGAFVAVAWVASREGARPDVFVAASADAGRTFASPVLVSGAAGADVSGEQPPRVVLSARPGRSPVVTVVWTAKAASGTRLLSARSEDGGRHFASPATVPGTDGAGNRGWESVAIAPDGSAVALWLDHRELAAGATAMSHEAHQHGVPSDGAARAQLSKLYFGAVTGGKAGRAIAAGVCYCCKTALAVAGGGRVHAAWRHVYPGNIRDIAFSTSNDGGKTFSSPVRVSEDRWMLDGCPENGPALAVDARRRIHVVWPTLVPAVDPADEPTLALFHAVSTDGRGFSSRQRLPSAGATRHPQLSIDGGDLVAVWDEAAGGRRRIAMARGTVDGHGVASWVRRAIDDEQSATYPSVAVTAEGPLVAWTSGSIPVPSVIRVARLAR